MPMNNIMINRRKIILLFLSAPFALVLIHYLLCLSTHGIYRKASKIRIDDDISHVITTMGLDYKEYKRDMNLPGDIGGWAYSDFIQDSYFVAGVNYGLLFEKHITSNKLPKIREKALWYFIGYFNCAALIFYIENDKLTHVYLAGT